VIGLLCYFYFHHRGTAKCNFTVLPKMLQCDVVVGYSIFVSRFRITWTMNQQKSSIDSWWILLRLWNLPPVTELKSRIITFFYIHLANRCINLKSKNILVSSVNFTHVIYKSPLISSWNNLWLSNFQARYWQFWTHTIAAHECCEEYSVRLIYSLPELNGKSEIDCFSAY
jgi:hypothetical protein